ncbi:hypothetical protein RUM44_006817 [Polyplax serrata]|uniref:Uncharacterized protein n=1 Tax=Polyplax serrata TaxID=468196 RepID=A0ABR1AJ52_POLSC
MKSVDEDCNVPPPNKISPKEVLGNRKLSSTSHATNNGFVMGNSPSSPCQNVLDTINDRIVSDVDVHGQSLESSCLLHVPFGFAQNNHDCQDEPTNRSPAEKLVEDVHSKTYLLPLEIVVTNSGLPEGKTDGEEDNSFGMEVKIQNSERLDLEDSRMCDNPITKLTGVQNDGPKRNFSMQKSALSAHMKKRLSMEKRKKLFMYLISVTGILILTVSIVHLIFSYSVNCLGEYTLLVSLSLRQYGIDQ